MSLPDNFSIEESEALLRAIFPNYPDIHGMKSVPESGAFLRALRAGDPWGKLAQKGGCHEIQRESAAI